MTYIFGILIIGLFYLALHYLTELTLSQKWWVITIVLSILGVAIMFNAYSENQSNKTRDIAMQFKQGKTLQCDGLEVNSTNYTLSVGTYTFIGKDNTSNAGQMISASSCE
ncbi:MAG: hypothetical protein Q9M32_03875 [Sulfurimonas sp.]|nr:hypothetical protein [Sulfurimonas sp.]MDQ7061140.1 hypothetical protein [Sulfurimonas sp.]